MLAHSTLENNFLPAPQQLPAHLLYPIITQSLQQPVGAFVTLTTKNGDLRGCIGNITTDQPLYKTAQAMAYAAAFQDSRFTPLTKEELDNVTIDITVLSQPRKIESYKDIVIGTQGIILHKYNPQGQEIGSALFLPQVAREHGWDIETTLDALSHKAGLDYDAWQENCSFEVFDGFEIKEAK
jgi:AmmeMemoRadiSam system protein A